ncbi:MAG: hypothetical protein K1X55_02035 [Chitinophagales bacterium]|nr:hypothetical protein [Chitinophagales bacterium]
MILVADSGSTKTDWLALDKQQQFSFSTIGFNPMIHAEAFISEHIGYNEALTQMGEKIEAVYFFGAGCSHPERNLKVENALRVHFPLSQIHVRHDLDAAVIALCQGKPGIACIIGTGSNSVYFDGEKHHKKVLSLGYVLGDEAGGVYFGKQLLKDYFYHQLPEVLLHSWKERFESDEEVLLKRVYNEESPNRFLASFAVLLSEHRSHAYTQQLLKEGFAAFFAVHVACFERHKDVPVHFVGSIAINFREELASVASAFGCTVGRFVQKPIQELGHYLLQNPL